MTTSPLRTGAGFDFEDSAAAIYLTAVVRQIATVCLAIILFEMEAGAIPHLRISKAEARIESDSSAKRLLGAAGYALVLHIYKVVATCNPAELIV